MQDRWVTRETSEDGILKPLAPEKHYTAADLSKLWRLSQKTIRYLFVNEPGVIKIVRGETRTKRGYTPLRIPEKVALRAHRRLQDS